jgi:hypothetical protein
LSLFLASFPIEAGAVVTTARKLCAGTMPDLENVDFLDFEVVSFGDTRRPIDALSVTLRVKICGSEIFERREHRGSFLHLLL